MASKQDIKAIKHLDLRPKPSTSSNVVVFPGNWWTNWDGINWG